MTFSKFLTHKYILVYFLLFFFDSLLGKSWDHGYQMDENFRLLWSVKWDKIFFEIEVKSHGYVGLGFSRNGTIESADICLGYVDDESGESVMQDFHVDGASGELRPDELQDCALQKGIQNRTHTVFRFSRKLETCDRTDDFSILDSSVPVLFFYTDRTTKQKSIQHKILPNLIEMYKGAQLLLLNQKRKTQSTIKFDPQSMRVWELRNQDVELPLGDDTIYWCKVFKLPDTKTKHHIIRFEPLYDSAESSTYLRHINLYECRGTSEDLETMSREQGEFCLTARARGIVCKSVVATWVSKSQGFTLPTEAGLPVDPSINKYYLMETHYTNQNPNLSDIFSPTPSTSTMVDSSGLKLILTSKLRKHDAGMMSIGVEPNWKHIIPPGHKNVYSEGHCISNCTHSAFPQQGINLLAIMFRTNLIGKETKFKIVRKNIEHELAVDHSIDPNRQEFQILHKPVTSFPGDQLIVNCIYDSSSRTSITLGGPTIKGEICQAMTLYYPKIEKLTTCQSIPSLPTVLHSLGIAELAYESNPVVISSPTLLAGMTLESRLLSYDWTNEYDKFQDITKLGSFMTSCLDSDNIPVPGTMKLLSKSPHPLIKSQKSPDNCDNKSATTYTTGTDTTLFELSNDSIQNRGASEDTLTQNTYINGNEANSLSKSKVLRSSITETMSYSSTSRINALPLALMMFLSLSYTITRTLLGCGVVASTRLC